MMRRPPGSIRPDSLFPYPPLFRSRRHFRRGNDAYSGLHDAVLTDDFFVASQEVLVEVSLGRRFAIKLSQLDGSFVVAGVLLFGSPHLAAQALYLRRSDRNVVLRAAHDAPDLLLDLRLQLPQNRQTAGSGRRVSV